MQALAQCLSSVTQLDALRIVHASVDSPISSSEVAAELRISPDWAGHTLSTLHARGLIASAGASLYRRIEHLETALALDRLLGLYRSHPVSVIAMIYSNDKRLSNFADAFRLRRPSDGADPGNPHD